MTPTDYQIVEAMIALGGSFVQHLGRAWRCADAHNRERLRNTFADYWETYKELATLQPHRTSER
jgi:hypothetical protein